MKKILLFLLGLFVLTGCSTEDESSMVTPPDVSTEISVGETRALPDSIAIALDNSILLQELTAYNDSILAGTIQPRISWGWLKKIANIAFKDFCGFATGMVAGTSITMNPTVGAVAGVVVGATYSVTAVKKRHPNQLIRPLPPLYSAQLTTFDRFAHEMLVDNEYTSKYNTELTSVGSVSSYGDLQSFLTSGVQHNLTVERFRSNGEFSSGSHGYAIPIEYRPLFYSDNVTAMIEDDMDVLMNNERINWYEIFSNRENQTSTYSQAKAAAVAIQFQEVIDNAAPEIESFRHYTLRYMQLVNDSEEIQQNEKTILLNMLPVYMYSLSYWSRNLVEE